MTIVKLTELQRAAILAGSSELELGEAAPAFGTATAPVTPAAAAPVTASAAAPAAPAPQADTGVVSFLTAQLAEKDKTILAAGVEIAQLKAASSDAAVAMPGLLAIAQGIVGQMQVALGNSNTSAALSAKDAVAELGRVEPVYKAKFPTGGIARTTPETPEAEAPHPAFAERLAVLARSK